MDASNEDLGLCLTEAKSLLKEIRRALLQDQIEEIGEIARVCRFCGTYLPVHDRRQYRIDTLFGRVTVKAPRVRICMCGLPGFPTLKVARSPLTRLLQDHATPKLRRLQAELGARHSFREAARHLIELTPCARQNHVTIRNRLAAVADGLAKDNLSKTDEADHRSKSSDVTVFLYSAYVRSRPEYPRRNFEIVVGSIESERHEKRRFGLSVIGVDNPREHLRRNLEAAGWRDGTAVAVLSDGDPALPRLVRDATGAVSITSWTGGIFQYPSDMWKRHSKPCFLYWTAPKTQRLRRSYEICAGASGMAKRRARLMLLKRCSALACSRVTRPSAARAKQRLRRLREQWSCGLT